MLAGLADASWRIMAELYRAGVQGNFDVATVHIFTGRPGYVMTAVELVGRELKRHGEGRKPIWVTEATFPAGKGRVPLPPLEWQRQWYTTDRGMGNAAARALQLGGRAPPQSAAEADLLGHLGHDV